MATIDAEPQNDGQRKLLDLVEHWQEAFNTDALAMVRECYSDDAHIAFAGGEIRGREAFLHLEEVLVEAWPTRKMRVDRVLFGGEAVAVVEAVILDDARPDFFSPFCAILTARGGKIVSDHTYLDPASWPSLEKAAAYISPGGLGTG